MGKKANRKKAEAQRHERKTLRISAMVLLSVLGVVVMAGMAMFNASAKPDRDMQWYVREGAVQVAAPALADGASASTAARTDAGAGKASLSVIVKNPDGIATYVPTEVPTEGPTTAPTQAVVEAPTEAPEEEPTAAVEEESDGSVTLTITAAGDCTFGGEEGAKGRRNFTKCVEKFGYDYFFDNVRHVFESDDLTIVNLEGPLTSVEKPGKHGGFIFKGDPDYVKILTGSSVELCNLANNHILDYGKTGLKETAQVLDENNVGYCGYTQMYETVIKGVRVHALGFTWWDYNTDQIVEAVQAARENCDLLIVNIHWGWEGRNDQDPKQTALGHAIIDAGADLIIGTHPHVYQGIEKYKGKYIVYSLGNFCFAGNYNPADKRCLIFQQTFSFNPGLGIAQANILDQGINIIPATVSSVRDINDFRPTIMTAENGASMLKAVASRSVNFDMNKVRWTKDNYMLTYGLIKPEVKLDANGKPITATVNAAEAIANAADEETYEPETEGDQQAPADDEAAPDEPAGANVT